MTSLAWLAASSRAALCCWANSFERPPGLPETPGCQLGLPALPISAICSQIGLSLTAEASMLMAALAPTAGEKLKAGLLRIRLPVMRDPVRWCWGWGVSACCLVLLLHYLLSFHCM